MYKSQKERVIKYLLAHKNGATNFNMMMALHLCDVRKVLSDIRKEGEYLVHFEWEISKEGTRYKRYFLKKQPKKTVKK